MKEHTAVPAVASDDFGSTKQSAPTREAVPPGSEEQSFYLTNKFIFGFLSFGLYWAWIFATYFTDVLVVPLAGIATPSLLVKGAGLAGAAVFLLTCWIVSKRSGMLKGFRFLKILPFVLGPGPGILALVNLVVAGSPFSPFLAMGAWFLMGFGTAAVLVQVDFFITKIDSKRLMVMVTAGVILSCVIYLVVANMFLAASIAAILVCILLESVVICISPETLRVEERLPKKPAQVTKLPAKYKLFSIQLCLYSVAFGLALCFGISFSIHEQTPFLIWVALCLTGPFLVLYKTVLNRIFSISDLSRVLLSCIAVALLPLPFLSAFWQVAFCAFLIFCFTSYDILSFCALASIIQAENLNAVQYFTLGRFVNAVGVFLGWLIGSFVFLSQDAGGSVFTIVCLGCVLALVILLTFSRESFTPVDIKPRPRESYWQQSCTELSEEGKLSPREAEVFSLLSRGRDTEYIRNALFISSHTVKTHTYHIYKKLGIHSQQEIISLVEQRAYEKRRKNKDDE